MMSGSSRKASPYLSGESPGANARGATSYLSGGSPGPSASTSLSRGGLIASTFLLIENIDFTIGNTTILSAYTTTEPTKCTVYGCVYNRISMTFGKWIELLTEHISPHSHNKAGLLGAMRYAVRLYASTDAGLECWKPSELGYYVIQTASRPDGHGIVMATVL